MDNAVHHYDDTDIAKISERCKSNTHRIDELSEKVDNIAALTTSVKVLAEREERVESDVKEIKADVKTITGKAAKRWDGIVDKALAAVVGALIAYLLAGGAL